MPASSAANDPRTLPLRPPKNPSPFFTGREDYIKRLKDYFDPTPSDVPLARKSALLYGMGGIGKTQICLKFVERTEGWSVSVTLLLVMFLIFGPGSMTYSGLMPLLKQQLL